MRYLAAFTTLFGWALLATPAMAEGGYYSGTLGAEATGRGGAFTAKADDLTAVSYNPAGLAKIGATLIQVGNTFSCNASSFTRAPTLDYGQHPNSETGQYPLVPFAKVNNQQPWQTLDPMLGVASNLGLRNWGFALAAYAPPGISREGFPLSGGQRYMMVSREAIILNYVASVAWKYRDVFGIGATAQWIDVPRLNYSLVIDGSVFSQTANPVSSPYDMLATSKGTSAFTFNAVLGAWYRPVPFLELALSGQVVPANVVAHSNLSVTALDPGTLGDVTLTRNGPAASDVTLTLPLPMLFRSGARYRHLEGKREIFDIELDVEYETWSRVKRFSIDTNGLVANAQSVHDIALGTINIDKNWRDTVAVRLGGDYALMPDRLTLRAGAYFESAVASPAYLDVDFPGGLELGGSLGASLFLRRFELAIAYQLRVQPSVSVSEADARVYQQVPGSPCLSPYTSSSCNPNILGQPSPVVNAGTYSATTQLVALDVLYRF